MAEYGAEVVMVGRGVASEHTSDDWPVNAMLRFPDRAAAEAFLADPRYLEIKKTYRDAAYETLHLTLVETRAPKVRTPKQVAEEAFEDFRSGLATGEWQPFLDRLSDDFTFHFPMGRYQGLNEGRERAAEFFAFVSQVYSEGLFVDEVSGVTAEGNRVVFEFADHGLMFDLARCLRRVDLRLSRVLRAGRSAAVGQRRRLSFGPFSRETRAPPAGSASSARWRSGCCRDRRRGCRRCSRWRRSDRDRRRCRSPRTRCRS